MKKYVITTQELMGQVVENISFEDADGTVWSVPQDPANSDYQAYLAQLAEEKEKGTN